MTAGFIGEAAQLLAHADPDLEDFSAQRCLADAEQVAIDYRALKEALLAHSAHVGVNVTQLAALLEQLRRVRRIAQQAAKAAQYLDLLLSAVERPEQLLASKMRADEQAETLAGQAAADTVGDNGQPDPGRGQSDQA